MARTSKPPAEARLTPDDRTRLRNEAERAAIAKSAEYLTLGRETIIDDLEGFRQVSMLDFFNQSEHTGRLVLKPLEELRQLSRHHQRWIKRIKIKDDIDGQTVTFDGVDVMAVIEKAGRYLKLWDSDAPTHQHLHLYGQTQRLMNMSPDDIAALRAQAERELREIQAEP